MNDICEDIELLQELLEIEIPLSYRTFLTQYDEESKGLPIPILGATVSLDDNSIWGATEFLRVARPDLDNHFAVIMPLDPWVVCLDLTNNCVEDAPVVKVDLTKETLPVEICSSFVNFLELFRKSPHLVLPAAASAKHPVDDYWFQRGLDRLGWHVNNLSFSYDHKEGGQLPRSHVWRPYRFCVQDIIFGITVVRHDRTFNRMEVDVFLTASISEYPHDCGCKAISLIILSDAYKSGGSMEIKFSKNVEGGKVPLELVSLANSLNVSLIHADTGGISPGEAKQLYLALSGCSKEMRAKITELEADGKLSSASICYGVHHGVWSIPELEVILLSPYPVYIRG